MEKTRKKIERLTPEQIAALTPTELRMEIAKRLGYTNVSTTPNGGFYGRYPDNTFVEPIRDWTTDISAAWELVEDAIKAGQYFNLYHLLNDGWMASIYLDVDIYGTADSAPLAICRAWLAWKESQNV